MTDIRDYHKKNSWLIWPLLGLFLVLIILNLLLGPVSISFKEFVNALLDNSSTAYSIIVYVRLPRTIACIVVGMCLAVSGLLLQAMFNNALASPGIIGINSGAGLAVVVCAAVIPSSIVAKSVGAFVGALLTAILIYLIAKLSGSSRGTLILAGIAISKLLSSISDAIAIFYPSAVTNRASFSVGSLSSLYTPILYIALPVGIVGIILAIILSKRLNILTLGDDVAHSLGLNVKRCRFFTLLLSALLASVSVSLAGLLSFLGLIAPHITRKLVGVSDYKRLTILSAIFGADITLLSDLLSRTIFAPYEIPVGILMALIGVPFFLFLLLSKGRRNRYDAY